MTYAESQILFVEKSSLKGIIKRVTNIKQKQDPQGKDPPLLNGIGAVPDTVGKMTLCPSSVCTLAPQAELVHNYHLYLLLFSLVT